MVAVDPIKAHSSRNVICVLPLKDPLLEYWYNSLDGGGPGIISGQRQTTTSYYYRISICTGYVYNAHAKVSLRFMENRYGPIEAK